jgi:hypothetical protein
MSTVPINYRALKELYPIEVVAKDLGLKLNPENGQYRAPCPRCNIGGERALVITPAHGNVCGLFYDFQAKLGGDVLNLVAHIKDISLFQAAVWLQGEPKGAPQEQPKVAESLPEQRGMEPISHLDSTHPAVQRLNMDTKLAGMLGIGYAHKGLLRGTLAVPVRMSDGTLIGYIGINEAKAPKTWRV